MRPAGAYIRQNIGGSRSLPGTPGCVRRFSPLDKAGHRQHHLVERCLKKTRSFPPHRHPITQIANRIIESVSHFDRNSDNRSQIDWAAAENNIVLPLSSAQLGIWFAQQIAPSSPAYNIGEYIEIDGSVDPILFEEALRRVVVETEALRVQIVERAEGPRQIVGDPPAWSMPVIDVSAEADARAAAESWMKADLARPLEPARGPLVAF